MDRAWKTCFSWSKCILAELERIMPVSIIIFEDWHLKLSVSLFFAPYVDRITLLVSAQLQNFWIFLLIIESKDKLLLSSIVDKWWSLESWKVNNIFRSTMNFVSFFVVRFPYFICEFQSWIIEWQSIQCDNFKLKFSQMSRASLKNTFYDQLFSWLNWKELQ